MDLYYLKFINRNYKYVINDTYYAVENETAIGIKINNLKDNKTTNNKAKKSSRKGNLVEFRFNKQLEIEDELEE